MTSNSSDPKKQFAYITKILNEAHTLQNLLDEREATLKTKEKELEETASKLKEFKDFYNGSIQYALPIQEAILSTKDYAKEVFPQNFVLYEPKDIVSGDFYFFNQIGDKKIAVAADCTGHGVAGALLSVVGYYILKNEMHKGVSDPSELLKTLDLQIDETFHKDDLGALLGVANTMEIGISTVDYTTNTLQFAASRHSLCIVRDHELIELKGDKYTIGVNLPDAGADPYENKEFEFKKNDAFYMFSDGIVDQQGGPNGKKYQSRKFKNSLLPIHDMSMEQQKEILETSHRIWRGKYEQTDDVVVVGVRL